MTRRFGFNVLVALLVWAVVLAAAPAAWALTFTVTRIDDPVPGACAVGDCSLREAIIAANANPGADVIVLGSGQTYTLTRGGADLPAALTETSGDLDIRDSVTINGNGSTVTASGLIGANADRVFHIDGASVVVTINDLTIKKGKTSGFLSLGAGLYVRDASVTLNNCTVSENTTAADATVDDGGGIAVVGTFVAPTARLARLTLDRTTVSGNAGLNGGGIACVLCSLAVRNNSVIQGNVATDTDGGGIVVVGDASDVSIAKSTIAGNRVDGPAATRNGGGLSVPVGASVPRLVFNRIVSNSAGATGAISTASSTVTAQNNWWGCNFGVGTSGPDCPVAPNGVSGGVVTAPYLVLKASSSPAMIPRNGHATATADLTVNSVNANTSGLGSLANTAVAFGGGPGTFQFPTVLTANGKANDDFTGTASGLINLTAGLDGQTVRFTQLVNSAPVVSTIVNQTTNEDTPTAPIAFTISDDDANPMTLSASATTNPALISTIVLGGSGGSRTVTITPAANRPLAAPSDTATITIAVGDGMAVTSRSFVLTVNAVNDAPTLNAFATPAPIAEDAAAQTVSLSGIAAGGGESQTLTVTATSNNLGLIPNPTVTYVSPSATGSLTYTPVAGKSGTAVITVTVQDNGGTASGGVNTITRVFTVVVAAVADTPSITNASTALNTQTTSGLVVSRNPADGSEVTHVRVTNITGGTLFKTDGVTSIANNAFITIAEGAAGLRFTPATNSAVTGHITIQASTSALAAGLGGATVTANITVTASRPLLVGADAGGAPHVQRFGALDGSIPAAGPLTSFFPFDPSFTGGVRVAEGDLNADGIPDYILGAGPGTEPAVRIFDGATGAQRASLTVFEAAFRGGVFVAAGDVDGDGYLDVVAGSGHGRPGQVKVFSGRTLTLLADTFVYEAAFTGGVRVAAGDVNGDGRADLIVGTGVGRTTVSVLSGADLSVLRILTTYPGFTGGVFVAAGDVTGDGYADIVTGAGSGGGPHVKVFDGRTGAETHSFFAFAPSFTGGVRVAAGDVNTDGRMDLIVGAGPGGLAEVRVFDAVTGTLLSNVLAYAPAFTGGVFVATAAPVSRMVVETPAHGATVPGTFTVAGWALEEGASGAGIAAIDVSAVPVGGGAAIALGAATLGGARPDIGAIYGAQYAHAGFELVAAGVAPGLYDLRVAARGAVSGAVNLIRTVRIRVALVPEPLLAIDSPLAGRLPGPDFAVSGWALTPDTLPAPGVDAVDVWAAPLGGGAWRYLGAATLGLPRPDVAIAFGPQYATAGYHLAVTGLTPGTWDLRVFPRRTGAAAFSAARVVRVTVPSGSIRSIMTGADAGGAPHVKRFAALGGGPPEGGGLSSFFAFDPSFTGGVRVAEGDRNGDGVTDYIAGAGPGGAPEVRIIDGAAGTIGASFMAFEPAFGGGVFVAAGDVNGDGYADVIAGSGEGRRGEIKVFSGRDLSVLRTGFVFAPSFTGGVRVAAGDVNGDGYADLVVGGGAGGTDVLVLNAIDLSVLWTVTPYPGFLGGAWVAAGDVTGDGFADVITGAGAGGGPHVRVFDGRTGVLVQDLFAYEAGFTGGVRVAAGDVNGDRRAEIITGPGPGRPSDARVFDAATAVLLSNVLAFAPSFSGGLFVATAAPVNRMVIETPANGATVNGPFQLAGWAFTDNLVNAGIDAIHVWAYPVAGGAPSFGGAATLGVSRPDVAAIYGAQYAHAGFQVAVAGLAPGVYDVVLFGHSAVSGTFIVQRGVRVTIAP